MMESDILAVLQPDHFDCDPPPEQAVFSEKHLAHGPTAESCLNDKTIDAAAREIAAPYRLLHGITRQRTKELHARIGLRGRWLASCLSYGCRDRSAESYEKKRVLGKSSVEQCKVYRT